jgi:uncharacterized protein (DUF2147 family)
MIKQAFLILLLCMSLSTLFAQANRIEGVWLVEDKSAHFKIYKSEGLYRGEVVWLRDPIDPQTGKPWLDKHNKDEKKRNQPIMGLACLTDFQYKDGEYIDGTIYDSRDGKVYKGKLWLEDGRTLKVRGYLGFLFQTETWRRVE